MIRQLAETYLLGKYNENKLEFLDPYSGLATEIQHQPVKH